MKLALIVLVGSLVSLFSFFKVKNIFLRLVSMLIAIIVTFFLIAFESCFTGDFCHDDMKNPMYKYEENHLKLNYKTGELESLDTNGKSLYICDSYKLIYKVDKSVVSFWQSLWPKLQNNYIYFFQVDIDINDDKHVYGRNKLFEGKVATGTLSLPDGSENFSLQNSKISKKEFYFFDLEDESEELEIEYENGDQQNFHEYLKNNASLSFNFYLDEDNGKCISPIDIEVDYLYRKNGEGNFQELKDGEVLNSGDQYKVEFQHDKDIDVYVVSVDDKQEKASVLFPCYESKFDSRLGFGSKTNPLVAGKKNILPNPTNVGFWKLDDFNFGEKQIHFLVFNSNFKFEYNHIGNCEIAFDKKMKDQVIFENSRSFKYVQ